MTQVILETSVENSNQNGAPKPTELANQKGENRKAFLEKHDPLHIVVQYADMASYYRTFSERMLLFAKLLPNLRDDDDWCTAVGIVNDRCERCLADSLDYCEKADDAHDEYTHGDGLLREQIDSQGILIDFVTGSRAFAELQDHVGLIIKSMPSCFRASTERTWTSFLPMSGGISSSSSWIKSTKS